MYDRAFIERICNLTCSREEIICDSSKLLYDTEYPFKKYYNMQIVLDAINKYLTKQWDDRMLSHWFCAYLWTLCGGFSKSLQEALTPIEQFYKETVCWDFDGMSFFDDDSLTDDPNFLSKTIQLFKNLDYIWQTRSEWKLVYSDVGELTKTNEDFYVALINDSKKQYMIVYDCYFHFGTPNEFFQFVEDDKFISLIEQLKADGYQILCNAEQFYYEDIQNN
ncbi:MAG: hypothetical protein IJD47_02195 [Clostridia bacterium]|nr:hypothetical protein [Clostridia bacterium]